MYKFFVPVSMHIIIISQNNFFRIAVPCNISLIAKNMERHAEKNNWIIIVKLKLDICINIYICLEHYVTDMG
jgi:hypothetical protein